MSVFTDLDYFYMNEALKQAKLALANGEIPVGCVITNTDGILAFGFNKTNEEASNHYLS